MTTSTPIPSHYADLLRRLETWDTAHPEKDYPTHPVNPDGDEAAKVIRHLFEEIAILKQADTTTFALLRLANSARFQAWMGHPPSPDDLLFNATELGGEVGELLNVAKKLHRQAAGFKGSKATINDLMDEAADVLICLDKLLAPYHINLWEATVRKFNQTSEKHGFPQRLA